MGESKNKIVGKTRQVVGKATGNRKMAAKGLAQKTVGRVQGAARKAAHALGEFTGRSASKRMPRSSRPGKKSRPMAFSKRLGHRY